MPARRKDIDSQMHTIAKRIEGGDSVMNIAREMGFSATSIRARLKKRADWPSIERHLKSNANQFGKRSPWQPGMKPRIEQMLRDGYDCAKIAREIGVNHATVCHWVREGKLVDGRLKRVRLQLSEERYKALYEKAMARPDISLGDIARHSGISRGQLLTAWHEMGLYVQEERLAVTRRKATQARCARYPLTLEDASEGWKLYQHGISISFIASKLHCGTKRLKATWRSMGYDVEGAARRNYDAWHKAGSYDRQFGGMG